MRCLPRLGNRAFVLALLAAATTTCDESLEPVPEPAAISVLGGDGQQGVVGRLLADSFVVQVLDRAGNPVPGERVTFHLTPNESGGVNPSEATTDANGRAAARGLLGTVAGEWSVEARVATRDGRGLKAFLHAVADPAEPETMSAVAGQNQAGAVGEVLRDSLSVRIVDRFGNPVPGVAVRWEATGGGTVDPVEKSTDAAGSASVSRRLGPSAGAQSANAMSQSVGGSPVTFQHRALAGAPATLRVISGDGQTGEPGEELADPLTVKATDGSDNPIEGLLITWSPGPGDGSADPPSSHTNAEGLATSTWTLGEEPGAQTLDATAPGLSSASLGAMGVLAAPASIAVISQPSATALVGRPFPAQPVVEVRDGDGDVLDDVRVKATIATGGGTLRGDTEVTTETGVARFSDLLITGSPGARTLQFRAGEVTALSTSISIENPEEAARGEWSAPFDWPELGIHLHLLPSRQVLSFGATVASLVWDQPSGTFTSAEPRSLLFCGGHAYLPDGGLMVTGGHTRGEHGLPYANIFDPTTRVWTRVASMAFARWYPTTTTLANGDLLTVGGSDANAMMVPIPEVWSGAAWRQLPDASQVVPYYPWMFQAPNGKVFYAGPSQSTQYLDPRGAGAWSFVANTNYSGEREAGSAVMYEPGKVLIVGGDGREPGTSPTATAEIIDLNGSAPAWRRTGSMRFGRRHLNATLLPTGEVLVTGGTSAPGFNERAGTVHTAELWNPTTGAWTALAANTIDRIYHSAAVLLPDGRLLVTGSGASSGAVSERNAEIYSPPYLFRGERPRLSDAPGTVLYGSSFSIETPDAGAIDQVTLLRLGSATHSFDQNQRFVSLDFHSSSSRLTVQAPGSGNVAPPGHYLLFLVNDNGVPSLGRMVRLH